MGNAYFEFSWKFVCPIIILGLTILAFGTTDLMSADVSEPYPLGTGFLPHWSISVGWKLGLVPVAAFAVIYAVMLEQSFDSHTAKEEEIEIEVKQLRGEKR